MKKFTNLLFSMAFPIFILFFIVATIYFSTNYDLDKALKLGILTGFVLGLGFSFIMTSIIIVMRKVRKKHMDITHPESRIVHTPSTGPINKKLILLMDRELAFEVALYSIMDQNIGEVTKGSKHDGIINIHTPEQIINLSISPSPATNI